MKRLRERRIKKKLMEAPEIKANNSNQQTREYVLKKVNECNCEILALVVPKAKIMSKFDTIQNKLYHYLCNILLRDISYDGDLYIIIDERDTNKLIKLNFENYIKRNYNDGKRKIDFHQIKTFQDNGLQVVDFIAWAISRKWNFNDDSYLHLIEKNIRINEIWK